MNYVNIKSASTFIERRNCKTVGVWILAVYLLVTPLLAHAFEVDFSRRQIEFEKVFDQNRKPASVDGVDGEDPSRVPAVSSQSLIEKVFDVPTETQEVALLVTEGGFVPAKIFLRKDVQYIFYVVNVHPREKNMSIVLDAFTEHQTLPFGQTRKIEIRPKAAGVFLFQSPELGTSGQLVITDSTPSRKPSGD